MEQAISFKGRLAPNDRNLTGDTEMRVQFIVEREDVPVAVELFQCMEKLLTVTVDDGAFLKDKPIRFRCKIPTGKSFTGGRLNFKATFDVPESDIAEPARFFALPDTVFTVKVERGDTTGKPLVEPAVKEKKEKQQKIKGPHWEFWQYLWSKVQFQYAPEFRRALKKCPLSGFGENGESEQEVKLSLYRVFDVQSCSDIDPEMFQDWLESYGLQDSNLVRVIKQRREQMALANGEEEWDEETA